MNKYLSIIGKYSWFLLSFLIFMTLLTIITTFTGLPISVNNIMIFIYMLANLFIIGFIRGKKCEKNGMFNGIILGFIMSFVFYLFGGIFISFKFTLNKLIYYAVLTLCTTLGAMVGINTKK